MNLISVNGITRWKGEKKLFENASFGVDEGDRIAFIGVNGCGKTTLLRLIAGAEEPDAGAVSRNRDARINFLEQTPSFDPGDTVIEHIFKVDNPQTAVIKRYETLCDAMKRDHDPSHQAELDDIMAEMERIGAWQYEFQVRAVLDKLGITELGAMMRELSGGMLKKVALARSLIDTSNIIILDEPTNHLDIDTIEWLQSFLQKTTKTVLLVTHDRYFLDSVCNYIIEIEGGAVHRYEGNYSAYLAAKSVRQAAIDHEEERIRTILRVELEWLSRGPKARATKQKARKERIAEMQSREFAREEGMELSVTGRRLGKKILTLKNVAKSFGDKSVISPFTHVFKRNEKIGVIGPNGSGKTTFLNLLTGRLEPDSGEIERGANTFFGYFDQHSTALDPGIRLIDFMKKTGDMITLDNGRVISASSMLERFLFPPKTHSTLLGKLSGGERRRIYLVHILMQNPNFLILDEPTNDFDIKTLSILEDFLNEYDGCMIVVSHDRFFMDRVADYLLVFDGCGGIKGFAGNFSDYMEYRREEEADAKKLAEQSKEAARGESAPARSARPEKKKLSFREQKEYEAILGEIEKLEAEKAALEDFFNSGSTDVKKINECAGRLKEVGGLVEEKVSRWEYLASIAESV